MDVVRCDRAIQDRQIISLSCFIKPLEPRCKSAAAKRWDRNERRSCGRLNLPF